MRKRKLNTYALFYIYIFILFRVYALRNLVQFFEHHFKIDELQDLEESEDRPLDLPKLQDQQGSTNKAIFTCLGIGYLNLNKGIL